MFTRKPLRKKRDQRRGAMVVLLAVVMILLIIGAVFSVDVAYMHMVRAELRTATDAAARAGSSTLARTQDPELARLKAIEYANKNRVAGIGLTLQPNQIQMGSIEPNGEKLRFVADRRPFMAVRVDGDRNANSPDGSVRLFFGQLLDVPDFQPTHSSTSAANVRDVALVLDVSGSMTIPLGAGTRMTALQNAVDVFLTELNNSSPLARVSLNVYSTFSAPVTPLTDNFALLRTQVYGLVPTGLTAIGSGIQTGLNSLRNDPGSRPFAAKTIILMTDGIHNFGIHPLTAAQGAVAENISIHTITFSGDANQSLMRQVAQLTESGQHFHADAAEDLAEVFREIAKNLNTVLIE